MTLEEFLRNPMDGFRPLTGIKVSELIEEYDEHLAFGFRPLTGIKVSEQPFLQVFNRNENCFRPLTGIKVSEPQPNTKQEQEKALFPSPHGD